MRYSENMATFRRLMMLSLLRSAPAYTLHEVTLKQALAKRGHAVGTDALRADIQWLHEQGLVFAEHPDGVWFAQLTAKGDDVERGLSEVPGVARPQPKGV